MIVARFEKGVIVDVENGDPMGAIERRRIQGMGAKRGNMGVHPERLKNKTVLFAHNR